MFYQILLFCFLAFFVVIQFAFASNHTNGISFVYGGRPYIETVHPSVINGKVDKKKMIEIMLIVTKKFLWGGTIIGDRFILTAAHCFVSPEVYSNESSTKDSIPLPSEIEVFIEGICHSFGNKTCPEEDEGKFIQAKTIFILEEYIKKNFTSGDLAIIQLAEVVGDHGATISDSLVIPYFGDFMASGFGIDPEDSNAGGHLLKTVTLTAKQCPDNHGYYDSLCTVEIDKDVCGGDSGGALINQENVIFGTVRSGVNCSYIYSSVIQHQSEDIPLYEFEGGVFTAVSSHYGFICDIVSSLQGCPDTFQKEPYLTIENPNSSNNQHSFNKITVIAFLVLFKLTQKCMFF